MEYYEYTRLDQNTSVWELGAIIEQGEEFYLKFNDTYCEMRTYGSAIQFRHGNVWNIRYNLQEEIKLGNVVKRKKLHWTDTLKDAIDEGVWCEVYSEEVGLSHIKLVIDALKHKGVLKYKVLNFSTNKANTKSTTSCYSDAIPLSKTLSDELDKLYNIKREQNNDNIKIRCESSPSIDCYI